MTPPRIPCVIDYVDGDGDGFVAFVDAPAYEGHIGDWDMAAILDLFAARSASGSLAIVYVPQQDCAVRFDVRSEPSQATARHEVTLPITITSGALWATSYTDLTMVADNRDDRLVDQPETQPVLALDDGDHTLVLRWLENPSHEWPVPGELVVRPGRCAAPDEVPGSAGLR